MMISLFFWTPVVRLERSKDGLLASLSSSQTFCWMLTSRKFTGAVTSLASFPPCCSRPPVELWWTVGDRGRAPPAEWWGVVCWGLAGPSTLRGGQEGRQSVKRAGG